MLQKQKYTPTSDDKIVQLYAEGLPFSTIAARINDQQEHPSKGRAVSQDLATDQQTHASLDQSPITVQNVYEIIQAARERQIDRIHQDRFTLIADELTKIDRLEQEYWIAWNRSVEWQTQTDTEKTVIPLTDTASLTSDIVNSKGRREPSQQLNTNETSESDPNETVDSHNLTDWSDWARIERSSDTQKPSNVYSQQTNASRKFHRNRPQWHPVYPVQINNGGDDDDKKAADTPKLTTTRKITVTPGDKRFLDGVQWCIDRRIKLLGLDAPTRTQNNNVSIQMTEEMTRQYITELALHHGVNPEDIVDSVFTDVQTLKQLPSTLPHNNQSTG